MRMIIAAVVIYVLDFITKWFAIAALKSDPWRRVPVIPGCLDFLWAENTGGAFSLLDGYPLLITLVSAALTIGIVWYAPKITRNVPSAQIALGMILGGAIGNLVDRIRFQYVVDFIHAYVRIGGKEHAWPTFNIADSGIVIGVGIIIYLSIFTKKLDPPVEEKEAPISDQSAQTANT